MAEPDRTNADPERVSDIVARLPRWNPRLGGVFEPGDQPFVYMAKDGLGEWVRRSEAADIIEAQSKALAEARVVKPLDWRDGRVNFQAFGVGFLGYVTAKDADGYPGAFWYAGIPFDTLEEAKAACQTDYSTRILSALTPAPENPNG